MVGYISGHINVMEEKEKLPLNTKDSFADLRQLIQRASPSEHSDTTDSFTDSSVEKKEPDATEDNTDDSSYETSGSNALAKPLTNAITQLVTKLVDERLKPSTVQKFQSDYILDAGLLKQTVHDIEKGVTIKENDKKSRKDSLKIVRLNTIVDNIKNQVDKTLITKHEKLIKAGRKSKYRYKVYELSYHKKNPLIDDILSALNQYKGFEYIAYADKGIRGKSHRIYVKLDYIWE